MTNTCFSVFDTSLPSFWHQWCEECLCMLTNYMSTSAVCAFVCHHFASTVSRTSRVVFMVMLACLYSDVTWAYGGHCTLRQTKHCLLLFCPISTSFRLSVNVVVGVVMDILSGMEMFKVCVSTRVKLIFSLISQMTLMKESWSAAWQPDALRFPKSPFRRKKMTFSERSLVRP